MHTHVNICLAQGKDVEGELNEEDIAVIGNAVLDLDGTSLSRMTPRAFENALPILQVTMG